MKQNLYLDLFAGAGGLSKGFELAGFINAGFVEYWDAAIKTYSRNFKNNLFIAKDIRMVESEVLNSFIGKIDVIVGGPPCQGFSMAGRRDKKDPRNTLFMEFKRFVEVIRPKVFVMENVPGLISMRNEKGEFVFNIIIQQFNDIGYEVQAKILNSANYNVPEIRKRLIFVGKDQYDNSVGDIVYPELKLGNNINFSNKTI